jgi:hypothetical protein
VSDKDKERKNVDENVDERKSHRPLSKRRFRAFRFFFFSVFVVFVVVFVVVVAFPPSSFPLSSSSSNDDDDDGRVFSSEILVVPSVRGRTLASALGEVHLLPGLTIELVSSFENALEARRGS